MSLWLRNTSQLAKSIHRVFDLESSILQSFYSKDILFLLPFLLFSLQKWYHRGIFKDIHYLSFWEIIHLLYSHVRIVLWLPILLYVIFPSLMIGIDLEVALSFLISWYKPILPESFSCYSSRMLGEFKLCALLYLQTIAVYPEHLRIVLNFRLF